MKITLRNCNCLREAEIEIEPGKLNLKYAPNGTGKTTLASAIRYQIESPEKLKFLIPFRYQEIADSDVVPEVDGLNDFSSVAVFDEQYIDSYTFKKDELMDGSFDVFIRDEEFENRENEIHELLRVLDKSFEEDAEISKFISDLKKLSEAFKSTKTGISKASSAMKAVGQGNPLVSMPKGLSDYQEFISARQNVEWLQWNFGGRKFQENSEKCPYCAQSAASRKELIDSLENQFDKNQIKHLNNLLEVLSDLGEYLSPEAKETLSAIASCASPISLEQQGYLLGVKLQVDALEGRLTQLRGASAETFRRADEFERELQPIDLVTLDRLRSTKTEAKVNHINNSIAQVKEKTGELEGAVNRQKARIQKGSESATRKLNDFLGNAGFEYTVNMREDSEGLFLRLCHPDRESHISGGREHLSFGERNALALVLFMHSCLSSRPDLIILDDPVSSFDQDKKFALLHQIFSNEQGLRGNTVLMLTHDIEPILDLKKVYFGQYGEITEASFMRRIGDTIEEKKVHSDDLKTFRQICRSVLESEAHPLIKTI